MTYQVAVLFGLTLGIGYGCSNPGPKAYFPLMEGAKWEYELSASITISTPSTGPQTSTRTGTAVRTVDGTQQIRGFPYFRVVTKFTDVPKEEVVFYRVGEDGVYQILGDDPSQKEELAYPLEFKAGQSWEARDPGGQKVSYLAEEIVNQTAGGMEYQNCWKISYHFLVPTDMGVLESQGTRYFAPGVGLVLDVNHTSGAAKGVVRMQLTRHFSH